MSDALELSDADGKSVATFRAAAEQNAVLLFDEADAIALANADAQLGDFTTTARRPVIF